MNIFSEVWSAPNTIVSWLSTRHVSNNPTYELNGITIYLHNGVFTNFCFGKFGAAQTRKIQHEYQHAVWSKREGPFYLGPYFYLIYSLISTVLSLIASENVDGSNLLLTILIAFGWFIFNELLAGLRGKL